MGLLKKIRGFFRIEPRLIHVDTSKMDLVERTEFETEHGIGIREVFRDDKRTVEITASPPAPDDSSTVIGDKILFGLVRHGENKFLQTYISKDDIEGQAHIEILPAPLNDIRIVWSDQGYMNFHLQVNGEEKTITGDAGFFQYRDGQYEDLSHESFRKLQDSTIVTMIFPNS
ncbi:hypothetical protein [Paenibacillus taichungensis]